MGEAAAEMPAWPHPVSREWAYSDLEATPDDGQVYEIVDGRLLVSPRPSNEHQNGELGLAALLASAAPHELVVLPERDVDLGRNVFVPDIVVIDEWAYSRAGPLRTADVVLAVEVTSPSSRIFDRIVKPAALATAGVPNYWRVDVEGDPFIELYELDAGTYKLAATARAGTPLHVDKPFALQLDPARLVR